jgi:creatinine amidohydrolase
MQLQLSTWPEVEAYLEQSSGIIIPIGSTEQHGPNGLIGTDAICPETIARGIAEEIDVMLAPTINIGMAQHHMAFPGTISLRPSTLMAVLKDVIHSLAKHGFRHIYFLNGHGGNTNTIQAAMSEIYAERSFAGPSEQPVKCFLRNWWTTRGIKQLSHDLFGDAEGYHATPSEVSLTFYANPDHIKQVSMSPKVAATGTFYDAADFRRRFPDGRIGSDPSLASIEAGKTIFAAAVSDITRDYLSFLEQ